MGRIYTDLVGKRLIWMIFAGIKARDPGGLNLAMPISSSVHSPDKILKEDTTVSHRKSLTFDCS